MNKKTFKEALKDSLNILPGYIVLGIGFGVLLKAKGYGFAMCLFMSGLIYAGSMQYVGIDLLSNGTSLITAFFMTIMVNIRHLFYGIGMLKEYQSLKKHRIYNIFALTDETFSIVCNKKAEDKDYYFFLSLLNHSYWITGSLIGNILGDILPFDYTGIDFSMTALFIVIVVSQWENSKDHLPVMLSFAVSLICLAVFGSNDFLIPSMVCIIVSLFVLRKIRGDTDA